MLRPAQLYKDELIEESIKSWYKPENIFYSGYSGDDLPDIPDNNYDSHHFVSVDKNDEIIGYICYAINWPAMSAYSFGIISFRKGNIEFARDVYQVVCDLFEKYHMNRISWKAYIDNPAVRGYRNFIKRHGGKECAYHRQIARLQDGRLHDMVEFEILAEEFHQRGNVNIESVKSAKKKVVDYGKIVALHGAGWSQKKIAEEMGVSQNAICVALKRFKEKMEDGYQWSADEMKFIKEG